MFRKFRKSSRSDNKSTSDSQLPHETNKSAVSPRQPTTRTVDSSSSSTSSVSKVNQICPPLVIHASEVKPIQPDPEMFIIKALEKILSDRDIKRSYNAQLRKACEESLGKDIFCILMLLFIN